MKKAVLWLALTLMLMCFTAGQAMAVEKEASNCDELHDALMDTGDVTVILKESFEIKRDIYCTSNGRFVLKPENGKKIVLTLGSSNYIEIRWASLTIQDITIQGAENKDQNDRYMFNVREGGQLILESGAVLKNRISIKPDSYYGYKIGSAVRIEGGGGLTMKPGSSIQNCKSWKGGAVYVRGADGFKTTFTMEGGSITNCEALENGGAVCMQGTNAVFRMDGGSMTGNKADGYGGGVYMYTDRDDETGNPGVPVFFKANDAVLAENTAGKAGADFAMENNAQIQMGTAAGAYQGGKVDGWYWDRETGRFPKTRELYKAGEQGNLYLIAARNVPAATPASTPTCQPTSLPDSSHLPKTGDERRPLLWLAALGGCAALAAALRRKK